MELWDKFRIPREVASHCNYHHPGPRDLSASSPVTAFDVKISLKQHWSGLALRKDKCFHSCWMFGRRFRKGRGYVIECNFLSFPGEPRFVSVWTRKTTDIQSHEHPSNSNSFCCLDTKKLLIQFKEEWSSCFYFWCFCWLGETLWGSEPNAPQFWRSKREINPGTITSQEAISLLWFSLHQELCLSHYSSRKLLIFLLLGKSFLRMTLQSLHLHFYHSSPFLLLLPLIPKTCVASFWLIRLSSFVLSCATELFPRMR